MPRVVNISVNTPVVDPGPIGFSIGSNLYTVLQDGVNRTQVWKSSDGGLTWNHMDAAHEPGFTTHHACSLKLTTTITVACIIGDTSFSLFDFNTLTDTWGLAYGNSGAEHAVALQDMTVLSTGSIVLFYNPSGSTMKFGFYTGAWAFANALGGVPADTAYNANLSVDATDITHVVIVGITITPQNSSYRQVSAVGALSGVTDLKAITGVVVGSFIAIDDVNHNLLLSGLDNITNATTLVIGAGIPAPSWSVTGDLVPALTWVGDQIAQLVGGQLFIVGTDLTGNIVQLIRNPNPATPTVGWAAFQSYNVAAHAPGIPSLATGDASKVLFQGSDGTDIIIGAPPPPPPPPGAVASLQVIGVISALGQGSTKCDVDGRKRCIFVKDRRLIKRNPKQTYLR